ncbi:MAG TPA: ankyrin repeat domain-containing protein [Spirochaetia bacterium]
MRTLASALTIASLGALLVGCALLSNGSPPPVGTAETAASSPVGGVWRPAAGLEVTPREGKRDIDDTLTVTLSSPRPITVTPRLCDVEKEPGRYRPSRRIVVRGTDARRTVTLYASRPGTFVLWIEVNGLDEPLSMFYTVRASRAARDADYLFDAFRPSITDDNVTALRSLIDLWPTEPDDEPRVTTAAGLLRPATRYWSLVFDTPDASGRTLFLVAAAAGAERIVGLCVDSGVDIDQADTAGMTALMLAARGGHERVVRLLRERDADPGLQSAEGLTALDYARRRGDEKTVALMRDDTWAHRVPDARAWAGEWRGHAWDYAGAASLSARITAVNGALKGELAVTTRGALSRDGRRASTETSRYAVRVFVKGGSVILSGTLAPDSKPGAAASTRMRATLVSATLMSGEWTGSGEGSVFYLEKKDWEHSRRDTLARGKVLSLTSIVFPGSHYTCYVPASASSRAPSPLVVFDNATGSAPPLDPAIAEQLGWVAIGLTESSNANTLSGRPWLNEICWLGALIDVRHRVAIDDARIYYAGFSGGALRSHGRASSLPDLRAAGVLDIGMGLLDAPSQGVPTFFVMGARDPSVKRFVTDFPGIKAQYGDLVALRVHSGGRVWRVPGAIAEGLRWLARQR